MNNFKLLFILFFYLLFIPDLSHATNLNEKRVALVVGNGIYPFLVKGQYLKNPTNDAISIAETLEKYDFEVILVKNASFVKMEASIDLFLTKINHGAIGLFFFAGHGVQIEGVNYLLTQDSNINDKDNNKINRINKAIKAQGILKRMEKSQNALNIIILDACRNNPFLKTVAEIETQQSNNKNEKSVSLSNTTQNNIRGSSNGLAKMSAPNGSILAYASAPNTTAEDNPKGKNGLYTKYLLKAMAICNLNLEEIFKEAGRGVKKESNDAQVSWIESSLLVNFKFCKKKSIFFKIQENNKKSCLSFDKLQNIFKLAGFNVVNNIKLADYVLDVEINTHSADNPVMEGLDLYAQFADIYLTVNNLKTKKLLYSSSSSGVTPHIDQFQGKKIAINNAIDKFETELIKSLINK